MLKAQTIRHIVAFSAKNPADIPAIKSGLAMLGDIPEAQNFSVSDNLKLDSLSDEYDAVLYAEFKSVDALETFKKHDLYQQCIDVVRPLRDKRLVLDF